MIKKLMLILYVIVFLWSVNNFVFAWLSNITKAPVIEESWLTTTKISWDSVPWAIWYYVYYSKESGKNYKMSEPVWENTYTLTNLEPNIKYYTLITAFDDNWIETPYSPELSFDTIRASRNIDYSKFWLIDVKATNFDKLLLSFTMPLENSESSIRNFKISQNWKEMSWVKESKITEDDETKLELTLDRQLSSWEFDLIILSIKSKSLKTIEEWVYSETKFVVPLEFKEIIPVVKPAVDNNFNPQDDKPKDNPSYVKKAEPVWVDLNSANPIDDKNNWIFWKKVETKWSNPSVVAWDTKKLPQSWPQEYFLLILSFILASTFLFFRKKVLVKNW